MPRGVTNYPSGYEYALKKCWLVGLHAACLHLHVDCVLFVCVVVYRFVRFSLTRLIFFVYLCCVFWCFFGVCLACLA